MKTAETFKFPAGHRLTAELAQQVERMLKDRVSAPSCWSSLIPLLTGHARPVDWRAVWEACFDDWNPLERGPAPMWFPGERERTDSNLAQWMRDAGFADVNEFQRWTVDNRLVFWEQAIDRLNIVFQTRPNRIVDFGDGVEAPQWLPGAVLNIAESCLQGASDAVAIRFGGPGEALREWTYEELRHHTLRVAAAIRAAGFQPGDPLAVVLPMTAESVSLYLGIIWAGCSVVSIADSFAPREINNRLRIANAQAVFTYDLVLRSGKQIPLYERVTEATSLPVVVLPNEGNIAVSLRSQDRDWGTFLQAGSTSDAVMHRAHSEEIINILFSSGTTGDPKAIPWTHTTPIKCAVDGYCHQDIQEGHVACWPTNLGWMMGPFLIFATLINRGTIALFEDAPVGNAFGRFVEQARVNMLGVIPTLVKNWRSSKDMEECDWSAIHVFSSTGESSQPADMFYLSSLAGMRPVIEYCGGTEIGGGYITSTVLSPNAPSTFTTPAVGLDLVILDVNGKEAEEGEIFLVPPSIGLSTRLLNRDHHETYFAGTPSVADRPPLRRHGDHFRRLPGGFFVAGGRVDDTMNLGGIKVSSSELERVLNSVPGVRETAAIALAAESGPEELHVFVVCQDPAPTGDLVGAFNRQLKQELNPLFRVTQVHLVESLPRTASNKVMRRLLRDRLRAGETPPSRLK